MPPKKRARRSGLPRRLRGRLRWRAKRCCRSRRATEELPAPLKRVPRGSPPGDRRGSPGGEADSGGAPRPPRALVRNRAADLSGPRRSVSEANRRGPPGPPPSGQEDPVQTAHSVEKMDIEAARSGQMFRDEGAPFGQGLPCPLFPPCRLRGSWGCSDIALGRYAEDVDRLSHRVYRAFTSYHIDTVLLPMHWSLSWVMLFMFTMWIGCITYLEYREGVEWFE